MAYVDVGSGPVVLFLHGNPTSSYLWRNIIPYVSGKHRAIAVDLIGMGDSGKPEIEYTFANQAAFVDGFIETLGLENITLVIHDWGSALGMRYARLNESNVRAVAFMEAHIPPGVPVPNYEAMGPMADVFCSIRTKGVGEKMILEENFFIEEVLPKMVMRKLTDEEMAEYRRPFATPESRRPTLMWPRELPVAGEPANMVREILANGEWLVASPTPKLHLHANPGAGNPPTVVEYVKANAKNVESVDVGEGLHFIQEDRPHEIGQALSQWLEKSMGKWMV
jgi:haloalkane dehalogenase